jgi:Holliday junction resolvase RusA-like endonuclease
VTDVPRGTFAEIIVPFPLSGNRYWRVWNKKIIKSLDAKIYINTVCLATLKWRRKFWEGRLFEHVEFYAPDDKARDLDNYVKILNDSLEASQVFQNDSQIDTMLLDRREMRNPGCAIVRLMELKDKEWYLQNNYANSSSNPPCTPSDCGLSKPKIC